MLSLYQARLVRPPVPAPGPLVVAAVYDTVYATWGPHATWSRMGRYAPVYARIPVDEQFGLEFLGGKRVPCPNTDKLAVHSVIGPISSSGGFMAHTYEHEWRRYRTQLRCWTCTYRSEVGGAFNQLRTENRLLVCHPPGRTVIHADELEASVPNATTGFDFERGCLIGGDGTAVVLVYGSPRARLTDRYLDVHLGPAERSYHGRDGALYVARAT
jgi:hypothetical protein